MQIMGKSSFTSEIVRNGKTLILFVANLSDEHPALEVERIAAQAFGRLSRFFKEEKQVIYIRDIHQASFETEQHWTVNYTDTTEVTIGVPRWGDDDFLTELLTFSINQALYALVRRQYTGKSTRFGNEVLNRGLSAYYAEIVTGYDCMLRSISEPDRLTRIKMARLWVRPYEHFYGNWKPDAGDLWFATRIGLEIADLLRGDDDPKTFCLEEGLRLKYIRFYDIIWALNHPKRKRSARILQGKAYRPAWNFLYK